MKILIIGGNGTIGSAVSNSLSAGHDVLTAGRTSGDIQVDITKADSIAQMLTKTGNLDAIICIAGEAKWADFESLTEDDYYIGLKSKLMGQVNLVRLGKGHLNAGGSITLSTGILADDPVVKTTSAAMVNGAIHSFVQAAALEMPSTLRLNAVSLGVVADAYEKYKTYFPGHNPVPMSKVVNAYAKSVFGKGNGVVYREYE